MKKSNMPITCLCRKCKMDFMAELRRTPDYVVLYCPTCHKVYVHRPGGARAWIKRWGPIETIMEGCRWLRRCWLKLTA